MYEFRRADVPAPLAIILAALPPEDGERLQEAFQIAAAAHAGQCRDEGAPFIEHPVAVAEILWRELGCRDPDVLVAALTHDVLEDCPDWSAEVLAGAVGERAARMVLDVTKPDATAKEKPARDRDYLDRLRDLPETSRLLKLADRIHNLRAVTGAGDPAKARRYLDVSRVEFYPLALATDATAARLVNEACDAIERYLDQIEQDCVAPGDRGDT